MKGRFSTFFQDVVRADCVTVKDYDSFLTDLQDLTSTKTWISDQMSYAIYERVPEVRRMNSILKNVTLILYMYLWVYKTFDWVFFFSHGHNVLLPRIKTSL